MGGGCLFGQAKAPGQPAAVGGPAAAAADPEPEPHQPMPVDRPEPPARDPELSPTSPAWTVADDEPAEAAMDAAALPTLPYAAGDTPEGSEAAASSVGGPGVGPGAGGSSPAGAGPGLAPAGPGLAPVGEQALGAAAPRVGLPKDAGAPPLQRVVPLPQGAGTWRILDGQAGGHLIWGRVAMVQDREEVVELGRRVLPEEDDGHGDLD